MSESKPAAVAPTPEPPATTPTAPVVLPSRGVLYGSLIPDGKVMIRKLTVGEMSILEGQGGSAVQRISAIIRACCRLPLPGINHSQLLITDRFAILLALRTFTYGPVYEYQYKCAFCGIMQKVSMNIATDLEEHSASDDLTEPITVETVDTRATLALRFLRGEDEDRVAESTKKLRLQSNDPGDPSSIMRLALQIVSIDGREYILRDREAFARNLTAADQVRIRQAVDEKEPGLDLTVYPDCRGCGSTNEMVMPFSAEFFRPSKL